MSENNDLQPDTPTGNVPEGHNLADQSGEGWDRPGTIDLDTIGDIEEQDGTREVIVSDVEAKQARENIEGFPLRATGRVLGEWFDRTKQEGIQGVFTKAITANPLFSSFRNHVQQFDLKNANNQEKLAYNGFRKVFSNILNSENPALEVGKLAKDGIQGVANIGVMIPGIHQPAFMAILAGNAVLDTGAALWRARQDENLSGVDNLALWAGGFLGAQAVNLLPIPYPAKGLAFGLVNAVGAGLAEDVLVMQGKLARFDQDNMTPEEVERRQKILRNIGLQIGAGVAANRGVGFAAGLASDGLQNEPITTQEQSLYTNLDKESANETTANEAAPLAGETQSEEGVQNFFNTGDEESAELNPDAVQLNLTSLDDLSSLDDNFDLGGGLTFQDFASNLGIEGLDFEELEELLKKYGIDGYVIDEETGQLSLVFENSSGNPLMFQADEVVLNTDSQGNPYLDVQLKFQVQGDISEDNLNKLTDNNIPIVDVAISDDYGVRIGSEFVLGEEAEESATVINVVDTIDERPGANAMVTINPDGSRSMEITRDFVENSTQEQINEVMREEMLHVAGGTSENDELLAQELRGGLRTGGETVEIRNFNSTLEVIEPTANEDGSISYIDSGNNTIENAQLYVNTNNGQIYLEAPDGENGILLINNEGVLEASQYQISLSGEEFVLANSQLEGGRLLVTIPDTIPNGSIELDQQGVDRLNDLNRSQIASNFELDGETVTIKRLDGLNSQNSRFEITSLADNDPRNGVEYTIREINGENRLVPIDENLGQDQSFFDEGTPNIIPQITRTDIDVTNTLLDSSPDSITELFSLDEGEEQVVTIAGQDGNSYGVSLVGTTENGVFARPDTGEFYRLIQENDENNAGFIAVELVRDDAGNITGYSEEGSEITQVFIGSRGLTTRGVGTTINGTYYDLIEYNNETAIDIGRGYFAIIENVSQNGTVDTQISDTLEVVRIINVGQNSELAQVTQVQNDPVQAAPTPNPQAPLSENAPFSYADLGVNNMITGSDALDNLGGLDRGQTTEIVLNFENDDSPIRVNVVRTSEDGIFYREETNEYFKLVQDSEGRGAFQKVGVESTGNDSLDIRNPQVSSDMALNVAVGDEGQFTRNPADGDTVFINGVNRGVLNLPDGTQVINFNDQAFGVINNLGNADNNLLTPDQVQVTRLVTDLSEFGEVELAEPDNTQAQAVLSSAQPADDDSTQPIQPIPQAILDNPNIEITQINENINNELVGANLNEVMQANPGEVFDLTLNFPGDGTITPAQFEAQGEGVFTRVETGEQVQIVTGQNGQVGVAVVTTDTDSNGDTQLNYSNPDNVFVGDTARTVFGINGGVNYVSLGGENRVIEDYNGRQVAFLDNGVALLSSNQEGSEGLGQFLDNSVLETYNVVQIAPTLEALGIETPEATSTDSSANTVSNTNGARQAIGEPYSDSQSQNPVPTPNIPIGTETQFDFISEGSVTFNGQEFDILTTGENSARVVVNLNGEGYAVISTTTGQVEGVFGEFSSASSFASATTSQGDSAASAQASANSNGASASAMATVQTGQVLQTNGNENIVVGPEGQQFTVQARAEAYAVVQTGNGYAVVDPNGQVIDQSSTFAGASASASASAGLTQVAEMGQEINTVATQENVTEIITLEDIGYDRITSSQYEILNRDLLNGFDTENLFVDVQSSGDLNGGSLSQGDDFFFVRDELGNIAVNDQGEMLVARFNDSGTGSDNDDLVDRGIILSTVDYPDNPGDSSNVALQVYQTDPRDPGDYSVENQTLRVIREPDGDIALIDINNPDPGDRLLEVNDKVGGNIVGTERVVGTQTVNTEQVTQLAGQSTASAFASAEVSTNGTTVEASAIATARAQASAVLNAPVENIDLSNATTQASATALGIELTDLNGDGEIDRDDFNIAFENKFGDFTELPQGLQDTDTIATIIDILAPNDADKLNVTKEQLLNAFSALEEAGFIDANNQIIAQRNVQDMTSWLDQATALADSFTDFQALSTATNDGVLTPQEVIGLDELLGMTPDQQADFFTQLQRFFDDVVDGGNQPFLNNGIGVTNFGAAAIAIGLGILEFRTPVRPVRRTTGAVGNGLNAVRRVVGGGNQPPVGGPNQPPVGGPNQPLVGGPNQPPVGGPNQPPGTGNP